MFHSKKAISVGFGRCCKNKHAINIATVTANRCKTLAIIQPSSSFSLTSKTAVSQKRLLSTQSDQQRAAIKSVISQGLDGLQSSTEEIQLKTRRRLLISDEDVGPSQSQIQEADRLHTLVEEALYSYTRKRGSLFCIMNEPISIIDVEVSEDLRNARVFWSLPYNFLLKDGIPEDLREKVMQKMQKLLETRGGPIQGLVHQKLRHFYRPPAIRWVPAQTEMIRKVLLDEIFDGVH